ELLDTEAPPPGVLPTLMELPVNETPDGADSVTVSLMEMFEPETMLILPELRDMLAATVTVPEPESPIVRLNDEMLLRSVGVIPNTPDKDVARTIGAGPGTRGLTRGIRVALEVEMPPGIVSVSERMVALLPVTPTSPSTVPIASAPAPVKLNELNPVPPASVLTELLLSVSVTAPLALLARRLATVIGALCVILPLESRLSVVASAGDIAPVT